MSKKVKTLRLYSYFPFLRDYQKMSKTVKNPQSLHLFFFLWGLQLLQKPSKIAKTLRLYSYFPFLRGYQKTSKTAKNPQSLQLFSFFEGSLAPPKTIKKCQKTSKTLRLYNYFPFLRGQQKTSRTVKNPQSLQLFSFFEESLFYEGSLAPPKTIKKCQKTSKTL